MNKLDIFMLFILVLIISIVMGTSVISMVNTKLSDVKINIPPLPKPNVIVNIKKNGIDGYDVYTEANYGNDTKEHFQEVKSNQLIKNDTNKIPIYTGKSDLTNPDSKDIVNYGDYVCYKKTDINKEIPTPTTAPSMNPPLDLNNLKCNNESVNDRYKTGDEKLPIKVCNKKTSWSDVDPADFYKNVYEPRVAFMDDPKMKGYNVAEFASSPSIFEIGRIRLDDAPKYPKPNNYMFK